MGQYSNANTSSMFFLIGLYERHKGRAGHGVDDLHSLTGRKRWLNIRPYAFDLAGAAN